MGGIFEDGLKAKKNAWTAAVGGYIFSHNIIFSRSRLLERLEPHGKAEQLR